jgi:acyl carrier protein
MESGVRDRILECIYLAIDEANEDRSPKPPLEKSPETPIHGTADGLDSLGLINFVVAVEEHVERELGVAIVLGDERALSHEPSPFESVRALVDYTDGLLSERRPVSHDAEA